MKTWDSSAPTAKNIHHKTAQFTKFEGKSKITKISKMF